MSGLTSVNHDDRRWIDFQHRGVVVTRGAMSAFIADRWRVSGGLKGLRTFAGDMRRGARGAAREVMPRHVLALWEAYGYPDCWINYRPDGMSCLIIIPRDRVIRVPRIDSPAMHRQFAAAATIQKAFGDLAPGVVEIGDGGSHAVESYLPLTAANIEAGDIETLVGRMAAVAPCRSEPVLAVIRSMTAGLNLPSELTHAAADLGETYGGSMIPWRVIHGDLMPHNVWRLGNGSLVAVDWEFAREAPASYDLWHLNLMPWIRGEISLDDWFSTFAEQLGRCLPEEVERMRMHHRLNAFSTAVFLARTGYAANVPRKAAGLRALLGGGVSETFVGYTRGTLYE